jgi:uncharacterized protein YjeT (DUF2065 family)
MNLLLTILAILWTIIGILLVILTDAIRQIFRNLLRQKDLNLKALSVIAFVVGLVLILGSSGVSRPWIAILLGLLGVAKGLFFIFAPKKTSMALIDWWLEAPNKILRIWGIVLFALGVILLLIL